MSDIKQCDRCGQYYIPFREDPHYVIFKRPMTFGKGALDLCAHCQEDLEEFVESGERIKKTIHGGNQ